ncbi:UDP-N-acetylbacillosamine N-acetyltransferase [compost metagenome]
MSRIVIYGSRQFAYYVRDLAEECGHDFVGFVDDFSSGKDILGTFDEIKERYSPKDFMIVMAIGYQNLKARWEVFNKVKNAGFEIQTLVHPKAYVHKTAKIGEGAIICVRTIIDNRVTIGEATFIWPGVTVNHDVRIGSNCFLSPQVNVCGFAAIGNSCFLGASSVIINESIIEDNSFIKAGTIYYRKGTS